LRDAGFQTHLYYGSNATFEHLDEFARAHGLAVHDISTLPPGLPAAPSAASRTPRF
jgi:hypothetical protein